MKKAQSGGKVTKKVTATKKYTPTAKEKKNIKDATQNKNMRPPFKSGGSMDKCKGGC